MYAMVVGKFISIFGLCVLFFGSKCDAAVISSNTSIDNKDNVVSTECTLPHDDEAFCVQIYDCLILLDILNITSLRARKCGPANENRKNPRVCCEKRFINSERTTTPVALNEDVEEKDILKPLPQVCGNQMINTRIVGGVTANQKEFPWLARLMRRDRNGEITFSCTGSLISSKVILTTAHCLLSQDLVEEGELYAVSLGEQRTQCSSEENECLLNKRTVMISNYTAHSGYNDRSRNHDNDIGLIFLRDEVRFTEYIAPICLQQNDINAYVYYVAGWGMTEKGRISSIKLKTSLPPFSWEQCVEKFRTINVDITPRQICAGGVQGKDACQGDSGGPLMVLHNGKWFVTGVVSFGISCGKYGWPGVYVYVPSYIDWIRKNLK